MSADTEPPPYKLGNIPEFSFSTLVADFRIHFLISALSTIFFYLSYRLLYNMTDCTLHVRDRVTVANTATSMVHASLSGTWSIICTAFIFNSCDYMGTSPATEYLLAFIIGFFIFDCGVMFGNRQHVKLASAFILHHICAISTYGGCTYYKTTNYCTISVTSEISNVCLHARKLMQHEGVKRTNIFYLVNNLISAATSIITRLFGFGFVVYQLTFNEPVKPGYMYEIVLFGNIVIGAFTYIIMRALVRDFMPRKVVESNGNVIKQD